MTFELDPFTTGILVLLALSTFANIVAANKLRMAVEVAPVAPQFFLPEKFARFTLETDPARGLVAVTSTGRRVFVCDMKLQARWKPSPGTPDGNLAAIGVVGRDRFGYSYVLEVWLRKGKPSAQLEAVWAIAERWGLHVISLESNGFQSLVTQSFAAQKKVRREQAAAGVPAFWELAIVEEAASGNEEGMIASMEPACANGWLMFSTSIPQLALLQFGGFPTSAHDRGGPVVVEWAWDACGRQVGRCRSNRPPMAVAGGAISIA